MKLRRPPAPRPAGANGRGCRLARPGRDRSLDAAFEAGLLDVGELALDEGLDLVDLGVDRLAVGADRPVYAK
jgi:hypothetical protein